jgi:ribose 5-phosphate isomerase A
MEINQLKKLAAESAVEEIKSGMVIGLGSGSTFQFALERIAEKIHNNKLKNILAIPSSFNTGKEAIRFGIPLITLNELVESVNGKRETENEKSIEQIFDKQNFSYRLPSPVSRLSLIDVTIDGADETDEKLNLIKGGGGALLHEKILAQASKKFIVIIDESKLSKNLGEKFAVPIEVIQLAVNSEKKYLESLGAKVTLRKNSDGSNFLTDENNLILDANFGKIKNPEKLSVLLNQRAGIVEHGLFINLTSKVYCAMENGKVKRVNSAQ